MPSSTWSTISDIFDVLMSLDPRPALVLDIGTGNGKYGFLFREYLQYWGRRHDENWRASDRYKIVGIEVFPDYINEIHRLIYDEILIGDAASILPTLGDTQFDIALMIDVLEHFSSSLGESIIRECQRVAKCVVISTPIAFEAQTDAYGNEFERHRSLWTRKMLYRLGAAWVFNSADANWVAIFTQEPRWQSSILARRRYHSNWRRATRLIVPYRLRSLFRLLL